MTEKEEEKKELKEKPTKPSSAWSAEEKKLIGTYGCQLIYEDATQEQLVDRKVTTDSMIIYYKENQILDNKSPAEYILLMKDNNDNVFQLIHQEECQLVLLSQLEQSELKRINIRDKLFLLYSSFILLYILLINV